MFTYLAQWTPPHPPPPAPRPSHHPSLISRMVSVEFKHHVYLLTSSVATFQLICWPLDRIERRQLSPVAGGDGVYPSTSPSHTQLRIEFSLLRLVPEILPNSSGLCRSPPPSPPTRTAPLLPPPLPAPPPAQPIVSQCLYNCGSELVWPIGKTLCWQIYGTVQTHFGLPFTLGYLVFLLWFVTLSSTVCE